jgi:DNA repair protein RecO
VIKTTGIILSIIPYSETSLIFKVLAWDKAQISILAKGWRKKSEPLLKNWEYAFILYEPKNEGLYLLKEAGALRDFSAFPSAATWAAAECGIELISKIIIAPAEAQNYYTLLREYLSYLEKVEVGGILIFWRLMHRVLRMMGIGIRFCHCDICQSQSEPMAMNAAGDLICAECYHSLAPDGQYQILSPMAREVLQLLPEIGNHLSALKLNRDVIDELNRLFFAYYAAHQKQTLKLKSLSVLIQFY